jgi:hypothetical protein
MVIIIYIYIIPYKPPHGREAGGVRTPAVLGIGGVGGADVLGISYVCEL